MLQILVVNKTVFTTVVFSLEYMHTYPHNAYWGPSTCTEREGCCAGYFSGFAGRMSWHPICTRHPTAWCLGPLGPHSILPPTSPLQPFSSLSVNWQQTVNSTRQRRVIRSISLYKQLLGFVTIWMGLPGWPQTIEWINRVKFGSMQDSFYFCSIKGNLLAIFPQWYSNMGKAGAD